MMSDSSRAHRSGRNLVSIGTKKEKTNRRRHDHVHQEYASHHSVDEVKFNASSTTIDSPLIVSNCPTSRRNRPASRTDSRAR